MVVVLVGMSCIRHGLCGRGHPKARPHVTMPPDVRVAVNMAAVPMRVGRDRSHIVKCSQGRSPSPRSGQYRYTSTRNAPECSIEDRRPGDHSRSIVALDSTGCHRHVGVLEGEDHNTRKNRTEVTPDRAQVGVRAAETRTARRRAAP
jgi:hypothetical protein